jgi:small nuclear ribonucleoprotein D3
MNVQMENINVTQRDGRVTHLDRVYIRGSHVRLFIVPDMLRYKENAARNKILNNR